MTNVDKTKVIIMFWLMAWCVITLVNNGVLNRIGEGACGVAT